MPDNLLGPDAVEWLGVSYKTVLSAQASHGAMAIVDSLSPAGSGPPRHIHKNEDEAFFLITGECEFWIEGKTFTRGPGETAFIRRGEEHTFRVIGERPCRHIVVLTPGGFEAFFAEMANGNYRIPEDMQQINESAARHGLTFTGPPLGT